MHKSIATVHSQGRDLHASMLLYSSIFPLSQSFRSNTHDNSKTVFKDAILSSDVAARMRKGRRHVPGLADLANVGLQERCKSLPSRDPPSSYCRLLASDVADCMHIHVHA